MKIGIAGIGGIGSNVARILAQAGLGQIKIVDFDTVEAGNLNRQFYRISQVGQKKTESLAGNLIEICPDMDIEVVEKKIGPGDAADLFADCSIVVEGLDDKGLKKMIIEELASCGIPVVAASGIAGPDMETVDVKQMGACHIVGDLSSDQDDHELFPPKIGLITSIMAGIALRLIAEKTDQPVSNQSGKDIADE